MRLPTQLQAIIFRKKNSKTEFLLLKRIKEKGGFWQPSGGGLEEKDNSRLDALYREIQEETGITKDKIKKIFEDVYEFDFIDNWVDGSKKKMHEHVFGVEVEPDTEVNIKNNVYTEHEEYRWVSFEDALKFLKWRTGKTALRKLWELLKISQG